MTEDSLNKERMIVQKMMERLKDYKPGSPEFKKLEEDVAQKQADFTVKAQIQKREFQEREASLYFKTIQEINDSVKHYSESKGISLVMKFNGDPVDPNDRDSVMRELNKPIMFHRGIDITPIILEDLNRGNAWRPPVRSAVARARVARCPSGPNAAPAARNSSPLTPADLPPVADGRRKPTGLSL